MMICLFIGKNLWNGSHKKKADKREHIKELSMKGDPTMLDIVFFKKI